MKKILSHWFVCFLSRISPRLNYSYRYWRNFGRKVNLKRPQTFNEKIFWLELNRYIENELVIQCSDKLRVRDYVCSSGCKQLLVPQLGAWDQLEDIEWDALPEKFVLKWNFGAGFNYICTDKQRANKEEVFQKMKKWGNSKYWLWYGEMHYKRIPKKIICEQYICDIDSCDECNSSSPEDYKFYCFNGKAKYILLCLNRKGMKADYVFFDTQWNVQPFSLYAINNSENIKVPRPDLLDQAIKYAEILAKPFPFVRVDFYILKDKIYFGELTFTPCGGVDSDLYSGDTIMGDLLEISAQDQ